MAVDRDLKIASVEFRVGGLPGFLHNKEVMHSQLFAGTCFLYG
ncbi:hypothetical protein BgramDRAFT_4140 [Paraburkholderia graminis C4D1M]|uniref:Uncharacterized protein n=1 Tax=Paraburkholderia graminis (strain ATCC 700544 / DSM 17151 / LMG 18924 / NCIMB 13744 / C4D1M) TaxID=396598 RepID=B1G475_PARG4|nr:hypothetical protein BgramDRAFT_4140 [Paraburkholderia graminis C4D1M]